MPSRKDYTDASVLAKAYEKLPSCGALASEVFGCSKSTIQYWMKVHGIEKNLLKTVSFADPTKPWTKRKLLERMYRRHGARALAKKWNCNPTTVWNWLIRFGIERRKPTGPGVVHKAPYEALARAKKLRGLKRPLSAYDSRKIKKETGQCERCGYNEFIEILEVHHLDRNRLNNKRRNLMVLCPNCHALDSRGILRIEVKRRKAKRFEAKG